MKNKIKGIILYTKKVKDNDLYIKVLTSNDEILSGMVYGGNSSKKKNIYQNAYFINSNLSRKNQNSPISFNSEISSPFIGGIFNDKYKMSALLSILSLTNLSILEGQRIKGLYQSIEMLIINIIFENHWISLYCEWLFKLLKLIGYQIDYQVNKDNKFFNLSNQKFDKFSNNFTIEFPHSLYTDNKVSFKSINSVFIIFENTFSKNHLDNLNYRMPTNYINFKKIILNKLS